MEFLIGRRWRTIVTSLLLDPLLENVIDWKNPDWPALLQREHDTGLDNGGLERLPACFLDSIATLQVPAMGYGLIVESNPAAVLVRQLKISEAFVYSDVLS